MKAPATLPPGHRVYAIGDVHGCDDRLGALHTLIVEDAADRPAEKVTIIHLGDYVDRGPQSRQVIERLMRGSPLAGAEMVCLMGNHEALMLKALRPPAGAPRNHVDHAIELWLLNGGDRAMDSYGLGRADGRFHVPREHLDWIAALPTHHRIGGYFFCHAGIYPGVPLDQQDDHNLVWIREPFLSSEDDHGAVVVHGHTPIRGGHIEVFPNRIGIDTAAVFGGPLTCLVLEGDQLRTLTA